MRIALIDPSLFTWPYDSALAEGLLQLGHDVSIIGKYLPDKERGAHSHLLHKVFYAGLQSEHLQSLPRPLFLALKGLSHILSLRKLLSHLRRAKPDVIHFQWVPLPVIDQYFIASFRKIAPVILTIHDSNPFNNNPGSGLQRLASISIMRRFDHLIVHTDQARQRLKKHGVDHGQIAQIPHGVLEQGMENFTFVPPAANDLDRPVTFLLFGKLKPYKGADLLLQALALMPPDARAKCRVRVVGKSYMDMEPLYALAKQLNVEDNVVWDMRFIDDKEIPQIFADADVIAMPYREIDASGVLMMALAAGRPILASRIGLFAEMLQDGEHGYLTPPEDVPALADALTRLVQDSVQRRMMGRNVLTLKASIPDWKTIAQRTEALYLEAREAG